MKYNFTVLIEQGEDGAYIATVPSLKSCYTQAGTIPELIDLSGNPIPASFRQIFRYATSAPPRITKYLLENLPKAGPRTGLLEKTQEVIELCLEAARDIPEPTKFIGVQQNQN